MPAGRRGALIVTAFLAIAPLGAVAAFQEHPLLLVIGVITWEALLLVGAFVARVSVRVQDRWAEPSAEWFDAAARRIVSRYARHYRYFLSRIHHDVDLRGLSTWGMHTLAMGDVFVDLSLRPRLPHQVPAGPVAPRPATPGEVADHTRRSIWDILDRYPDTPLAVLGPPGSGKTTLLRHVTLVLCGRGNTAGVPREWRRKLPILLFLREHVPAIIRDPGITLPDVLRRSLARLSKKEPPSFWDKRLDAGRCLVMLDGLDEVARSEDRAAVLKWVRRQMEQYARNRFVMTSRPFGFTEQSQISATVLEVREFTDAQMERFVHGWYRTVERRSAARDDVGVQMRADEGAAKLLSRLYASPALLALATNPLLLTMIASVHKYRAALPGSRAELYGEICQVFLGKRLEAKEIASELTIDQKSLVLRRLAYTMMERRIRDIGRDEAAAIVAPVLQRVGYGAKPADFLTEIERTTGLLLEQESGVYAFAHLTFQEYLGAVHLNESQADAFLAERVGDVWWREVILLYVARADASAIVRAALAVAPATFESLSLAADCVDHAREVDSGLKALVGTMISFKSWSGERRRLVTHVLLSRKLQQVIKLAGGGFACAEPVSRREFEQFARESDPALLDGSEPRWIIGVDGATALMFVTWLGELGLDVRLPHVGELTMEDVQRLAHPPLTRFWTATRNQLLTGAWNLALSPGVTPPLGFNAADVLARYADDTALVARSVDRRTARKLGLVTDDEHLSVDPSTYGTILEELAFAGFTSESRRSIEVIAAELMVRRCEQVLADTGTPLGDRLPKSATAIVDLGEAFDEAFQRGMHRIEINPLGGYLKELWQASEHSPAKELVRAHYRIATWALANAPLDPVRSAWEVPLALAMEKVLGHRGRDRHKSLLGVAQCYLIDMQEHGFIRPHEGIVLVRN